MKVTGIFNTDGDYHAYKLPINVFVFGNTLREEDGFVIAVKDSYDDWVCPRMLKLGIKSKIKVEE